MFIMKYKSLLFFASFMFFVSSCTKEIDLKHLQPDPKLVLNSLLVTGDSVKVRLTRTWFYTETNPDVTVKNANIKLYANGVFKDQMEWKEYEENDDDWYYSGNDIKIKGYYISSYQPKVGDNIKITAEAEGFKSISAEAYMPNQTYLKDLKIRKTQREEYGTIYPALEFLITIKDDPDKKDFYLIDFDERYPEGEFDPETFEYIYTGTYSWRKYNGLDYSTEPLFTSHITALEQILEYNWISAAYGRAFSDDLINGKEYTIKIKSNKYQSVPENVDSIYYRVNLYTITEEYYRYINAIIEMKDGGGLEEHLADIGLAEPVRVFSNIEGGVGIMGSALRDSISALPIQ